MVLVNKEGYNNLTLKDAIKYFLILGVLLLLMKAYTILKDKVKDYFVQKNESEKTKTIEDGIEEEALTTKIV